MAKKYDFLINFIDIFNQSTANGAPGLLAPVPNAAAVERESIQESN